MNGDLFLVDEDSAIGSFRNLVEHCRDTATGWIAQNRNIRCCRQHSLCHMIKRCAIGPNRLRQSEIMTAGHDCCRMITDITRQNHFHARLDMFWRNLGTGNDIANSGCIDEYPVGFSLVHNLRITSDNIDSGFISHLPHCRENPFQVGDWKAFLQNQAG